MLVLDRTGSMCDDGACSDLNNAKRGIKQFLTYMDPAIDYVGLAVFPPALPNNRCATPTNKNNWNYDTTDSRYVISSLQYDYLLPDGNLNPASTLVQMIDCTKAAGRTSYADAIEESMTELATHGRGNVQDVIVFLSDGAANTGSKWRGNDTPYRLQPCHQGVWSAGTAKANNMIVYTIGYGLRDGLQQRRAMPSVQLVGRPAEQPGAATYPRTRGVAADGERFRLVLRHAQRATSWRRSTRALRQTSHGRPHACST